MARKYLPLSGGFPRVFPSNWKTIRGKSQRGHAWGNAEISSEQGGEIELNIIECVVM